MTSNAISIKGAAGGPFMTNSFAVVDTASGQWALVDPSYEVLESLGGVFAEHGAPARVLITHGHFDHIGGLAEVLERYPDCPVHVHPESAPMLASAEQSGAVWVGLHLRPGRATDTYAEGDTVALGETTLRVIEGPGHCPGSVMIYAPPHLIAGDVLFQGGVGRWDLPNADYDVLARTIREKVMTLPDETIVHPGHGPSTTIGEERRANPIVQAMLAGERL